MLLQLFILYDTGGDVVGRYTVQVVMPVYNAAKTLNKSLDSLICQTYKDWQVILVDDYSKDNSLEILNDYAQKDNRFCVVALDNNCGASGARNKALDLIDAKYVAFLDSDDYWEPQMLEKMVNLAENNNCDVVQCRFIYDFPGGRTYLPSGAFKKDVLLEGKGLRKVYLKMMTGINMNHVCMKLIRSSLIHKLRFDTSLPTAEDLEMCVRMFENVDRYYFTTDVMYHYCRYENSITGSGLSFKKRMTANIRVSKTMVSQLKKWGMNNPFYKTLALLRPYIIIVSKVFRIIREKLLKD